MEILDARCHETPHVLQPTFEVRFDPSDMLSNFYLLLKLGVDQRLLLLR